MKKLILFLSFLVTINSVALNVDETQFNNPKVGDVFVINKPSGQKFDHIKFPKSNIIRKRGGLANYKNIYGKNVIVKNVKTKNDGTIFIQVELQNGNKFFGYLNTVKVDFAKAMLSGEITVL